MIIKRSENFKQDIIEFYNTLDKEDRNILEASYQVVAKTKASDSRVQEIIEFCKAVGYKKIGIAFCKGFKDVGEKLDKKLSEHFEVYSVCCNLCGISKEEVKVMKIKADAPELACNPIGQAMALNEHEPELAIKVGFCLGHDLLFSKYIEAKTTTFAVKDRKHKHNPIKELE